MSLDTENHETGIYIEVTEHTHRQAVYIYLYHFLLSSGIVNTDFIQQEFTYSIFKGIACPCKYSDYNIIIFHYYYR